MSEEKMMNENPAGQQPRMILSRAKKRLIFYIIIMAYPILQFLIFYVYQNFSSIAMAFQDYAIDYEGGSGYIIKTTFANFGIAWRRFAEADWMIKNSLRMFLFTILVSMNLAIIFSFYIYKKCPGAEFFRVILFMPQVVSSVVYVLLFRFMATNVYIEVVKMITGTAPERGLLNNPDTALGVVIFYNIWHSFGANVLMYCGTMSGIDESLVESAHLDGANIFHEFIYITFPMIYRTYITFLIVSISGILTNQMALYTFFGNNAGELSTIGYDIYISTLQSDVIAPSAKYMSYPVISAYGLILTLIISPLTILIKKGLEKIGPSAS